MLATHVILHKIYYLNESLNRVSKDTRITVEQVMVPGSSLRMFVQAKKVVVQLT